MAGEWVPKDIIDHIIGLGNRIRDIERRLSSGGLGGGGTTIVPEVFGNIDCGSPDDLAFPGEFVGFDCGSPDDL